VSAEAKLEVDEETYLDKFRPHLMDVVYTWANGSTFAQICKMTDVFEGNNPTNTCHLNTCTELRNG
jgi:ATP-dependent RNA helicase DOB1